MSDLTLLERYQVLRHEPLAMSVPAEMIDPGRMDLDYYRPRFIEAVTRIQESGLALQSLDCLRDPHRIITDGVRKHTKTESGVVLIRTQNFEDTSISLDDCAYIDVAQHQAALKSAVREGDLLIAIRGYLGKAAIVGSYVPTANINQHIARVTVAPNKADTGYLWAFFSSLTGTALMERQVTGTVQKGIMLPVLRRLQVPLPPRPVQTYIGDQVRLAERCRTRARELRVSVQTTLDQMYRGAPIEWEPVLGFWVDRHELDSPRLDSWHYQPAYRRLVRWCREQQFVPASSIASLSQRRWSPSKTRQLSFHYIEISDVDVSSGQVSGKELSVTEAPGRARQLVRPFDVLVSTVRPERKGVGIAAADADGWVASTGFSILQARSPTLAFFLTAVLRHDGSTLQMMRWNTGATYPAVDAEVPLNVLIPDPCTEAVEQIGCDYQHSIELNKKAVELVQDAKADVEALIEGRLDVEGILAGRVRAPVWEGVTET